MKIAVVAGGWHFPGHFYREIAAQSKRADLFVVTHRSPELPIVREEKRKRLSVSSGPLADLDRKLYSQFPTIHELKHLGWHYQEAPNTVGDMGFFKQWLETHDYRDYDLILNCHDDLLIRSRDLLAMIESSWEKDKWLILCNGKYDEAPEAYIRGSFGCWSRELLDLLGGRIDLGKLPFTREGKVDTPEGMKALSAWNQTSVPLRKFLTDKKLAGRVASLSPYYRISPWVIECERGFLNQNEGAPWSFTAGLKALAPELGTGGVAPPVAPDLSNAKITVYTVIIDSYDELKPPAIVEPGVRYVCFSNTPQYCPPWEIRGAENLFPDARRNSRIQKILSHRYIDSEYSIYHDGSCILTAKPTDLVREFLSSKDLAMYKHPVRVSIRQEREACIKLDLCSVQEIDQQIERYKSHPKGAAGLWSGGIIFRRNTETVKAFNELWWKEYLAGCVRDQIALPHAIAESGIPIHTIPDIINADRKRFKFHYHKKDAAYKLARGRR